MSFNNRWNNPGSTQSTGPHELHKLRRAALNPFFSKKQVLALWPYIVEKSDTLCRKIDEEYCDTGKPLNVSKAFACFSLDVITEYAFGDSFNDLENDDFHSDLTAVMTQLLERVHVVTHFPWLLRFMNSLPVSVQQRLNPGIATVNIYQIVSLRRLRRANTSLINAENRGSNSEHNQTEEGEFKNGWTQNSASRATRFGLTTCGAHR